LASSSETDEGLAEPGALLNSVAPSARLRIDEIAHELEDAPIAAPHCHNVDRGSSVRPRRRFSECSELSTRPHRGEPTHCHRCIRPLGRGRNIILRLLAPNVVWRIEGSGSSAGVFNSRAEFIEKAVHFAPFHASATQ